MLPTQYLYKSQKCWYKFSNGQQNDSRKHTLSVSNLNLYTTQYLDGESNLQQVLFRKKPFMKGDKLFNYNIDKVFWKCIEVYFYIDDMCMQSFMQLSNNKQHLCMSGCEPQDTHTHVYCIDISKGRWQVQKSGSMSAYIP